MNAEFVRKALEKVQEPAILVNMMSRRVRELIGGARPLLINTGNLGVADIARIWPQFSTLDRKIGEQLEIDAKYAVYLDRQTADVAAYRRDESFALPDEIDYATVTGLSNEARQKLQFIDAELRRKKAAKK